MALYCWGNTINGELGVGGVEEEQINTPRLLNWNESSELVDIALGSQHTLFLTANGKVYVSYLCLLNECRDLMSFYLIFSLAATTIQDSWDNRCQINGHVCVYPSVCVRFYYSPKY